MKTLFKWLGGLVVLLLIVLGGLLALLDPNAYKTEIISAARDKAQLALQIDGDIGWSLFPTFALTLPKLSAADLNGQPIAAVERVEVAVAVMPLLSGKLQMSGLTLDGLRLDLTAPPAKSETDVPVEEAGRQRASASGSPPQLDIGHIAIRDAQIRYRMADGQQVELSDFSFDGERIISGKAFPAKSAFKLRMLDAKGVEQLSVTGELSSRLLLDLAMQRYVAEQLTLELDLSGALLPAAMALTLGGDFEAEPGADRAAVSNLSLKLANFVLGGSVQVSGMSTEPLLSGRLEAKPFDLNALLQALGQPAVVTQDGNALKQIGFSAVLTGPINTLTLNPLRVQLDQSRFEGMFGFDLLSGRQTLKLAGDSLNLDRYLPPPAAQSEPVEPASPAQIGERYPKTPLLPVELMRTLNFEVDLSLGQLQASGVKLSELKVLANASAGHIRVPEVSGKLYEGGFRHSALFDLNQTPIALKLKKSVKGVKLGPLLNDAAQFDQFSGLLSLEGDYSVRGNSVYAMVHSLNGNSQVKLKDGRMKGVNLVDKLCQGIRNLQGQPAAEGSAPDYTEFSNLGGNFKITDGVVKSDDLSASLIVAGLAGKGLLDLPKEHLDWGLDLTILQQIQGEQCQIEEKLHNIAFPLLCEGGFDTPPVELCRPDTQRMKDALKQVYQAKVKAKVDAAKESAKQKLGEQLKSNDSVKGALKGLFK